MKIKLLMVINSIIVFAVQVYELVPTKIDYASMKKI